MPLHTIEGRVIRGAGYGRRLGFPTANLDRRAYLRKKMKIPFGVYAGTARITKSGKFYKAGIVIGPLDRQGLPKIEAHFLDFEGDLYGEKVELFIHARLRPFQRFQKMANLVAQIENDIRRVRKSLSVEKSLR